MLDTALSLCEEMFTAGTAAAASLSVHRRAARLGAISLQSRLYRRPAARLTNATHWAAGGFVVREAPAGWVGSAGYRYICLEQNPLLEPIRLGLTRYRITDFTASDDRGFATYWEAFSEGGFADVLCASAYGSGRRIGSVHIGIADRALDPAHQRALSLAAAMLSERLLDFAPEEVAPAPAAGATLSARERDALAFVAEGKTDWEIGAIMGVAESTARFHVDNARRKLDAVNRAHAVARFLALYGPV